LKKEGFGRDTHSVLDTGRSQGVGFLPPQTKELTDDQTQEDPYLACRFPIFTHTLNKRLQTLTMYSNGVLLALYDHCRRNRAISKEGWSASL
jgi:hypothetical protein